MPRARAPENMSYAELTQLKARVDQLMVEKKIEARTEFRKKVASLAKAEGLSLEDVLGGKKDRRGSVAIKYRDPKEFANTWTGRGRMPKWLVAETRGGKAKKDDFLI
jgi:DNA-binding protein H-NS